MNRRFSFRPRFMCGARRLDPAEHEFKRAMRPPGARVAAAGAQGRREGAPV